MTTEPLATSREERRRARKAARAYDLLGWAAAVLAVLFAVALLVDLVGGGGARFADLMGGMAVLALLMRARADRPPAGGTAVGPGRAVSARSVNGPRAHQRGDTTMTTTTTTDSASRSAR